MKEKINLCLVAVGGDCSKNGMGPYNEVIPFNDNQKELVREFLSSQAELGIAFAFFEHGDPRTSIKKRRFFGAFNQLKDVGVFQHKYHSRTEWVVEDLDMHYISETYGPSFLNKENNNA